MIPWFVAYPLLAALLGGGGAKLAGKDPKKGALLGAGLGLGWGALPLAGGAATGGAAGWNALGQAAAAKGAGAAALAGGATPAAASSLTASLAGGVNPVGMGLGKLAGGVMGAGAGAGGAGAAGAGAAGAGGMTAGTLAKQALITTAAGGALSAAMPKYGMTQPLMDVGHLSPPSDVMAQLEQLMRRKGGM